jgi:hypothetical protein
MEYSISVHNEKRYVEVNVRGQASVGSFQLFIGELLASPYVDLRYDLLVEITELDPGSLGSDDVRNIVGFLERHKEQLKPKKHAIIAESPVSFGFARMYQILAEDFLPMSVRVFGARDQALKWLRDEKEKPLTIPE